ncbi:MAG: GDP-mannose 4,6-dehydratase [Candidatus Micrarchaeota archaeon]|nr:GDP-mannose 4,6-dehydratase [Candidatus Micrarchaeota archaeon]
MKSFYTGKSVLVTGATGLVGPYLVQSLLDSGASVTCLVRDLVPDSLFFAEGMDKKVNIARGEVEDAAEVERTINEYEPEVVFHLGAQALVQKGVRSPVSTFRANIEGTWNVLEACRTHDKLVKAVVIASSDKAYGEQTKLPYTEDSPMMGRFPYDVSKSCADLIAQSYGTTYGMPVTISRCGNFFGGGDLNFSRIVPGTLKSAFLNERPVIRSDGSYVRDYIYVKDAASAYMALGEKTSELSLKGEAFNFSNEQQLTVLELVQKVLASAGKQSLKPDIKNEPLYEIKKQHLDASKAHKKLGWKSEWGIDKGLKETAAWYKAYFSRKK